MRHLQYFDVLDNMSVGCISSLKKLGYNEYSVANALANQINEDNFGFRDKILKLNSMPIAEIPHRLEYSIDIKSGLIVEIIL